MKTQSWIRDRLAEIGSTQAALAKAMDLPPSRITMILKGERQVQLDEVPEMAGHLQLTVSELLQKLGITQPDATFARGARLVGYVGAGETIYPMDENKAPEYIPLPPGETAEFCLIVNGSYLEPRFRDGEYLFYDRIEGLDIKECYGLECVITLRDGRKMVSIVERGSRSTTITLIPIGTNRGLKIERDVEFEWVAPISSMRLRPKRS